MAANLEEVVVSARIFPNVLALPVSAQIGDLEVETSIEESYSDDIEMTEHPIENGAAITDHSYKLPSEVILRCGWSNASLKALAGIVTGFFAGGTMSKGDYVSGVYSQLLKIQGARQPISITTGLRHYDNMLIKSVQIDRDRVTSQILSVSARCREALIVSTQSASLPPKENQATPASTAESENAGAQQATDGFPAPGGTVPPNEW